VFVQFEQRKKKEKKNGEKAQSGGKAMGLEAGELSLTKRISFFVRCFSCCAPTKETRGTG